MLFTLIAVAAAGLVGGIMAALLRWRYRRIPGWVVPVTAGALMLAATISSEYGWFGNTRDALPEGVEIVATHEHRAPYQPWTYLVPYINGFVAVDGGSLRTNDAVPDLRLVNVYVFARWQAPTEVPIAVDCAQGARADLIDGVEFDADGRPEGVTWREVPEDDALLGAVCG
ncbi:hypothetical protein HKCCE2091_21290 [Rhodobacterales bacterium HKCCE2091]|nr:hypothetical protein [Rhodobacterales bacterium HKCCE2091]